MKKYFFTTTALILSSSIASADIIQDRINSLFNQGYTHFEVERGSVKSKIEAYTSNGQKLEVVLDNNSGNVLSSEFETMKNDDHSNTIREIENRHDKGERYHSDDDDNRGRGGNNPLSALGAFFDNEDGDNRGRGRSYDDSNDDNDRNDDHGSSHNSNDDNDRNDDNDHDDHDDD